MGNDFLSQRLSMIEDQIRRRGVNDPATLSAMLEVPREQFVPLNLQKYAYADSPLNIGSGQTISQPYIVALMTQAAQLKPEDRALDIGTGSGYAAAILSRIVKDVYSIERIPELTMRAESVVKQLGYNNIYFKVGDGTLGWPEKAPFDAILVTAGAPVVPESLLDQLNIGGRVIIPVGDTFSQELLRLKKTPKGDFTKEILEFVRFVPLIGKQGWNRFGDRS